MLTRTINNGVVVKLIKTEQFKTNTISIAFSFPVVASDLIKYNLLLSILTTRNKKHDTIKKLSTYLSSNYSMSLERDFNFFGNELRIRITSTGLDNRYALSNDIKSKQVKLLFDTIFNPLLNEESFREMKSNYLNNLRSLSDRKKMLLLKNMHAHLGNDNPYGYDLFGNIEDVEKLTLDDIKAVYSKLIASNASIYMCGNFNLKDISRFNKFNLVNNGKRYLNMSYLRNLEKETIEYKSEFLQSIVALMYQVDITYDSKLFYPYKLFLEMLDVDMFNIIREKYNYCYYISSISNPYINAFNVVSEIEYKYLDKVKEEIDKIINNYIDDIDEVKFRNAKNKVLLEIKSYHDHQKALVAINSSLEYRAVKSINELYLAYKRVSKDEVKEVAKKVKLKKCFILKEKSHEA